MKINQKRVTRNFEGGISYRPTPELELFLRVATNFVFENKYYLSGSRDFALLVNSFNKCIERDPEYVAKLLVFAREQLHLRSVPVVGLVLMANHPKVKGTGLVRRVGRRILTRPDMLTEALSLQLGKFGKPIPNSLKKALADAFVRFDAYQLAKYRGEGRSVKLRDVMYLVHPKPINDEQAVAFKKLAENKLKQERTWEAIVSRKGSSKEVWEEVAREFIKYKQALAALRNLRNMIEANVDMDILFELLEMITDVGVIKKAKIYPYHFFSAYKALLRLNEKDEDERVPLIISALENGLENLLETFPKLEGRNVVAVDVSGSMTSFLSSRSHIRRLDVASLYGVMLAKRNGATVYAFSTDFAEVELSHSIFESVERVRRAVDWEGTHAHLVVEDLLEKGELYDRMIILTDEVIWDFDGGNRFVSAVKEYRRCINKDFKVVIWDLAGYGHTALSEFDLRNIFISGFSEKALDVIGLLEQGERVVDVINNIEL